MVDKTDSIEPVERDAVPERREREDVIAEAGRHVDSDEFERAQDRLDEGRDSAAAIVYDEDDRILLIRNEWSDGWTFPAGLVRHEETLDEGARREVREETGVDPVITDLLYVYDCETVHEERGESMQDYFVVFEGQAVDADPGDPDELGEHDDEIEAVGWFDELPDETTSRDLIERLLDW